MHDIRIVSRGIEMPGFSVISPGKACRDNVSLRSVSNRYPEVSLTFLRIYTSLCRVLHTSGGGEAIDKILRDWERIGVLAKDGRDAELLSARLRQ
jgi:hypothetical protein